MNFETVKKTLLPYLILFVLMGLILFLINAQEGKPEILRYDTFMEKIKNEEVKKIKLIPRTRSGIYEIRGEYVEKGEFVLNVPLSESVVSRILLLEEEYGYEIEASSDPESSTVLLFLINILPIVILIAIVFLFIRRQIGSANKSMDFGKSKAKLNPDSNNVTFDDVAGLTEEKEEVAELIDFLKNPKRFQLLGARIPKGVLLVGAPGTGKTLLAKAVAGEASVPFYYISGSDFVELFVGVGASRVRDMFRQAKMSAPCLIFIDEIDAVGRQRGAGLGGGHDEREQTLNQLLTEMDGFGANEGIIIIAATNRPDVLDPALLRPGRFDRQVTVNLPDVNGRKEILEVHARGKKFDEDVSLENIARRTVGFSGADLENLLNEAALLTVRRNKKAISVDEVDEAQDRVLMGPAKVTKKYTIKEKRLVAYHEAGHAVLGIKLDGANEVQKITIIPRGTAGGYNLMVPKEETFLSTKKELLDTISGLLGGRVAEEIVFKEVTTGAHNDFGKATKIARAMVTEYGMSDLGPVQLEHHDESVFLGRDYNKIRNFSGQVAFQIDQEIRKIISERYEVAKKIIGANRKLLDLLAETLIEKETLTKEEIEQLYKKGELKKKKIDLTDKKVDELKTIAKKLKIRNYSKMNKDDLKKEIEKIS